MRFTIPALAVALAGCGPAMTGPTPGGTYFWQMLTSTVEFGACTDDPQFRETIKPVPISANSFVVYKVSADGKTAITQQCTRLDPRSCTDPETPNVYDIMGSELTRSESFKNPIEGSTCFLAQTVNETITEQGRSMTFDLVSILTLVDSPADCERVESGLKASSPNMLGVEGCVITRRLTGELK